MPGYCCRLAVATVQQHFRLLLIIYCACAMVRSVDAHFNLFMNESETKRLLGIPGGLYYVKDGVINDYALTFNLPIKSHVDVIFFNWQSLRLHPPVRYSMSVNVSVAGIINTPLLSVDYDGNVPTRPSLFSLTLVCTGTTSSDVDIKLQLNATVLSPTNVTTLDIRRKKTCVRGHPEHKPLLINEGDEVNEEEIEEQIPDRTSSILAAAEHGIQTLTSGYNAIYVGVGGACLVAVVAIMTVLIRRFCATSARKSSIPLVSGCERKLAAAATQHPYQLTIKSQFRSETPTSNNSIISGIGSIHRGLSYVVYSELKPSDVDDILRDAHISRDCVALSEILLEGSYSKICRGTIAAGSNYSNCQSVVVKMVNERARKEQVQAMLREACLLKGVAHSNIASVQGISYQETQSGLQPMVMYAVDCADNHNLKTFLHRCRIADQLLGVAHQVYAALQINAGLQYLHRRRVIHRDVATRNCLVDGQLRVRLTDGALSRDLFPHDYQLISLNDSEMRPVKWMSPEVLTERRHSTASDVWSFGVAVWELFTFADQPYVDIEVTEMVDYLTQGYRIAQPDNCPNEIYQMLISCWIIMPEDRPRLAHIQARLQECYSSLTRFI